MQSSAIRRSRSTTILYSPDKSRALPEISLKASLYGSSWCGAAMMTCGSRQGTLSADMVPSTTSLLIVPGTPVTVARVTIALFAKEIGKCEQAMLHEQQFLTKTD